MSYYVKSKYNMSYYAKIKKGNQCHQTFTTLYFSYLDLMCIYDCKIFFPKKTHYI